MSESHMEMTGGDDKLTFRVGLVLDHCLEHVVDGFGLDTKPEVALAGRGPLRREQSGPEQR